MTHYGNSFHAGGRAFLGWCDRCHKRMYLAKDGGRWPTKLPNGWIVCGDGCTPKVFDVKTSFIQP